MSESNRGRSRLGPASGTVSLMKGTGMSDGRSRGAVTVAAWMAGFEASLLGDAVFMLALTYAALESGDPAGVAVVVAAASVARVVVLIFGGAITDRLRPRFTVAVADGARMVILLAAAGLLFGGLYSIPFLVIVSAIAGIADALHAPAAMSMPADFAGRKASQTTSSANRTIVRRTALVAGGALAGIVVGTANPAGGFLVAAGFFAVSVVLLPLIRTVPRPMPATPAASGPTQLVADVVEGFRAVRRAPGVGSVLVMIGLSNLGFAGPMTAAVPIMAAHRGWGAQGAGFVLTAFGLGAVAAGLLFRMLHIRRHAAHVTLLGMAGMSAALVALGLVNNLAATLVIASLMGLASGASGTFSNALVVANLPKSQEGRAHALFELMLEVVAPVSIAVAAAAATAGASRATFVIGGALGLAGVVYAGSRASVRSMRVEEKVLAVVDDVEAGSGPGVGTPKQGEPSLERELALSSFATDGLLRVNGLAVDGRGSLAVDAGGLAVDDAGHREQGEQDIDHHESFQSTGIFGNEDQSSWPEQPPRDRGEGDLTER